MIFLVDAYICIMCLFTIREELSLFCTMIDAFPRISFFLLMYVLLYSTILYNLVPYFFTFCNLTANLCRKAGYIKIFFSNPDPNGTQDFVYIKAMWLMLHQKNCVEISQ